MNKATFSSSWNRIKKAICFATFALIPLLSFGQEGGTGQPVTVTNFEALTKYIDAKFNAYVAFIINNFIAPPTTALLILNSEDIANAMKLRKTAAENLRNSLTQEVTFSLADDKAKREDTITQALLKYEAEDDFPPVAHHGIFSIFFDTSGSNLKKIAANAAFNADSFFSPFRYDEDQRNHAYMYLNFLESTAPINPVIRPAERFEIPFSADPKESYSMFEVDKEGKYNLNALIDFLKGNNDYLKYRLGYRSQIAARSLMLNVLQGLYQERTPATTGTSNKSLLETEANQASRRLTPEYYTRILTAAPADVSKETLLVLAEIRQELFLMRLANEKMMAMQAISGLQAQSFNAVLAKQQAKEIGKLIYCWKNKDSSACTAAGVSNPTIP
jgi:hypothetical protein